MDPGERNQSLVCSYFDFAFELVRLSHKEKLPEIHLKHAIYLEDEVDLSDRWEMSAWFFEQNVDVLHLPGKVS